MTFQASQSSMAFALEEIQSASKQITSQYNIQDFDKSLNDYLRQYCNTASMDEFAQFSAEDAAHTAISFWAWAQQQSKTERSFQVRPCYGAENRDMERVLFEIAGPDLPFLVDSAVSVFAECAIELAAVVHPVVDGQSLIQIHTKQLSPEQIDKAQAMLIETFKDVEISNQDHMAMRKAMRDAADSIEAMPVVEGRSAEDIAEASLFLKWLESEHFFFLGAREYRYLRNKEGEYTEHEPEIVQDTALGILRDPDRHILSHGAGPAVLTPRILNFLNEPSPLIVAKSNVRSNVHRRVYADYVGVKRLDEDGHVIGELRFAGLFTSAAYTRMARDVPLIRRKVAKVVEILDVGVSGYSTNALNNVLETYPRDELFQIDENDLARIAYNILALQQRPRTRLFIRRDRFDRYVSALLFTPRENYSPELRRKAHDRIAAAFEGRTSAYYPSFNDGPLARVHYIIGLNSGHPDPDIDALDLELRQMAESWEDALQRASNIAELEFVGRPMPQFNLAYKEAFTADEAVEDLRALLSIPSDEDLRVRATGHSEDGEEPFVECKIYHRQKALALSDMVPVLENMGMRVLEETGFPVRLNEGEVIWIHSVKLQQPALADQLSVKFEDAFKAVWTNHTENDGFNQLVVLMDLSWREAALLRTLCRYRLQSGLDPSEAVQINALTKHPDITAALLALFKHRLDPAGAHECKEEFEEREARQKVAVDAIVKALDTVPSLDDDRVLRRLMRLICSIQRTNFYQVDKNGAPPPYISIKIASQMLENLPAPKPFREIFVWSPQVEGVHLRFGPVARGGLRWSDRRDDFRTEVLGLVKAQQVKNAVIVPVGSKGGFFPKQLPETGTREDFLNAGIAAYKTFISSILQLTDNIIDGAPKRPENTFSWDGDDPYLVVAADKGTATFSDIANGLSQDHAFWLDDAFASGGSAGYDHKKMGITARGAWEAVKRHFREIGKNIQTEPFTCIGVGDMSGDVFGNGMLLSDQTCLLAAFNHMHIFVDPTPDPANSFTERRRLFDLGRSTWEDYDKSLISKGGGIFSRQAKSISLTPQMKSLTGLTDDSVTPDEFIRALLKSEAELLWFGGIGTYIKASNEVNSDAGDKANDALRINGADLNVKIIGEGANLGMTQAGRIEFARNGGRLNTDAIDNSAGVDSSDHEVNIKILLKEAILSGELKSNARNDLLASMTDAVAKHVLHNNYEQTGALSQLEATSEDDNDAYVQLMSTLESEDKLNREVEGLPDAEDMKRLKDNGLGLTRPELAVLMAYAKNDIFALLVNSSAPDDAAFEWILKAYFPDRLDEYEGPRSRHRLKREIIATRLANRLVDLAGPAYPYEMRDAASVDVAILARAMEAARQIFGIDTLISRINALDNDVPAEAQIKMRLELSGTLKQLTGTLILPLTRGADLSNLIRRYEPGVAELKASLDTCLSTFVKQRITTRASSFMSIGAPQDLAMDVSLLRILATAKETIDCAEETDWPLKSVALIQHAIDDLMGLDRLRAAMRDIGLDGHWERLALRRMSDALPSHQATLTKLAVKHAQKDGCKPDKLDVASASEAVSTWLAPYSDAANRFTAPINQFDSAESWTLAKLALAGDALREFVHNIS